MRHGLQVISIALCMLSAGTCSAQNAVPAPGTGPAASSSSFALPRDPVTYPVVTFTGVLEVTRADGGVAKAILKTGNPEKPDLLRIILTGVGFEAATRGEGKKVELTGAVVLRNPLIRMMLVDKYRVLGDAPAPVATAPAATASQKPAATK